MSDVPWHYLRRNHASRYPRRFVCFDTESEQTDTDDGTEHTFRCAAASFDVIDPATLQPRTTAREAFSTPDELLDWLEARAVRKERTVVFAHNLAFDLRIGRVLDLVSYRGWALDFVTLDSVRCVAKLSKDGRTLIFTDSASWLPKPLQELARMVGIRKPPLPAGDDSDDAWRARCAADVEVLRAAMLELLSWLERSDMGNWRLTGPAQAMAAYRHRFMREGTLLVHRDDDAIDAERRAAWSGRCELYRHGLVDERVEEWDFTLAYLTVARDLQLPVQLRGTVDRVSVKQLRQLATRGRVLVECDVTCDRPVLPAELDGRTVWPVGSFTTTVWERELLEAVERGTEVTIRRCWLYWQYPVLRDWSEWLLAQLDPHQGEPSELVRVMLKHWARCLIGRFGVRYPDWQPLAQLDSPTIGYEPVHDVDTGEQGAHLFVGHQWLERVGLQEGRDSMPAIMSAVMAQARIRLLHAMEAAGMENVIYVDTDSLLVTRKGVAGLRAFAATPEGAGLRCKGAWSKATLKAPRQLSVGQELRAAGVPRSAREVEPGVFAAEVWEGLGESLRRQDAGSVLVRDRTYRLRGRDRRRRHLRGGLTEPLRLDGLTPPAAV